MPLGKVRHFPCYPTPVTEPRLLSLRSTFVRIGHGLWPPRNGHTDSLSICRNKEKDCGCPHSRALCRILHPGRQSRRLSASYSMASPAGVNRATRSASSSRHLSGNLGKDSAYLILPQCVSLYPSSATPPSPVHARANSAAQRDCRMGAPGVLLRLYHEQILLSCLPP